MTKKHFIALADVFRDAKPIKCMDLSYTVGRDSQWSEDVERVCQYLSTFPNFNRERWIDYVNGVCGPSGGKL